MSAVPILGASAPVVLALDVAGTVGWCVGAAGTTPRTGSVRLARPEESRAAFLWRLGEWLANQITELEPVLVAIEAPQTPVIRSARTARQLVSAAAIVELVCFAREIAQVEVAPQTVRKHFCGDGRAKKPDVMAECVRRGWIVPDADAGDAAATWQWACDTVLPRMSVERAA